MIKIFVNGEQRDVAADSTLQNLIGELDMAGRRIAVELNEEIIPRSCYAETALQADDKLEIVHAIGGG